MEYIPRLVKGGLILEGFGQRGIIEQRFYPTNSMERMKDYLAKWKIPQDMIDGLLSEKYGRA